MKMKKLTVTVIGNDEINLSDALSVVNKQVIGGYIEGSGQNECGRYFYEVEDVEILALNDKSGAYDNAVELKPI